MADIFSLAPEGQAWNDYDTKPANKADYDPRFFAGSSVAFFEGIGSGTVGLGQTAARFGKQLITDPDVMNQFAPSYGVIKALFPDADEALNASYDAAATGLTAAQKYVKPDANSQGTAAQVLYGLGQFVPAIGATIATGPAAGGAVAFGSTYEPTRQEFIEKGVDTDTANTLAVTQGAANALGMSLPVGVGTTLTTRILSGIGINTGFGMVNRYAIGDTLEAHNYQDLAKQYRAWDGQAMLIDGVLGLAFGSLHHLNATRVDGESQAVNAADEQLSVSERGVDEPVIQREASTPEPLSVMDGQTNETTANGRVAELQSSAGQLLPRGDRKVLQSEIANSERILARLNDQRSAILGEELKGSGNLLSDARADKQQRLRAVDEQIASVTERLQSARDTLEPHMPGGEFYDAKSELSRIRQGIKPSDIDAAHTLNDGLHYDLDSSPVLHGTAESLNAHVAAMNEAARAIMSGEPVNVSQQIRGLEGVVRPDDLSAASERQADIQRVLDENGVSYADPLPTSAYPPEIRQDSAFLRAANEPGHISTDPDTGTVISSNSYDLLVARDMAVMNPETKILHPDTGQEMTLSEVLADLDNQIAAVQKESKVYSAAAACFLRNS